MQAAKEATLISDDWFDEDDWFHNEGEGGEEEEHGDTYGRSEGIAEEEDGIMK